MAAHIIYNRNTPFGAMTAELAGLIYQAQALADRIKAAAVQIGAGNDPTTLETGNADGLASFGVAPGQGAAFWTAIGYVHDGVNAIAADQLANIDLGS
jgi:hypothetical protein